MSLPKETLLELMSYADGEPLDAAARARVDDLLRTSDEARRVVDAMGALGDVVREGLDGREEMPPGIADAVMAAIEQGANVGAPVHTSKVVPLRAARPARAAWLVSAAAVAAIAAGFFVMVSRDKAASGPMAAAVSPYAIDDGSSLAPESTTAPAASQATAQAEPGGVELREVRSIQNKVNVFFMPAKKAAGTTSIVVWIDDKHGGR